MTIPFVPTLGYKLGTCSSTTEPICPDFVEAGKDESKFYATRDSDNNVSDSFTLNEYEVDDDMKGVHKGDVYLSGFESDPLDMSSADNESIVIATQIAKEPWHVNIVSPCEGSTEDAPGSSPPGICRIPEPTPEPGTMLMLICGCAGLLVVGVRSRQRRTRPILD